MRTRIAAVTIALLVACAQGELPPELPVEGDVGNKILHRLNRAEYDNTVRDLLGTARTPARDFPPDDHAHGFDNIAGSLTMSPLHVELYENAARELAEEYWVEALTEPVELHFEAEDPSVTASTGDAMGFGWNLWSNGTLEATVDLPLDGTYQVSARVFGQQAGDELVNAILVADGAVWLSIDVAAATEEEAVQISASGELTAGIHTFGVGFTNDFYIPEESLDRNLMVDWIRLEGPTDAVLEPNPRRVALDDCTAAGGDPVECAMETLAPLADRAFRRPATATELDDLRALVQLVLDEGDDVDRGAELATHRLLLSPDFLFRVELDPDPTDETEHPLNAWELATRLSYFVWSSMPDDELFAAAADGSLLDGAVLAAQARRMLADPKADALVENFAGQWLTFRAVDDVFPDPWYFPDFDEELRSSMRGEMERFFETFLREDRSMLDLLVSTETYVDQRLAEHYGIGGVSGDEFVAVDVSDLGRPGVFGQAGFLTVNAFPTRTSPVLRGKWVLERLICQAPSDPPAGVEGIDQTDLDDGATLREILEAHREDPSCASCHALMDPIGLGLEHFDGVGAWRDVDTDGNAIDATGDLPDRGSFDGAQELADILAADPAVPSCIAKHLFTYALGRARGFGDRGAIEAITADFVAGDHRFEELVVAIVLSDPFRNRRGEAPE